MKKIRVGVAGVGHLGSLHLKMLVSMPDVEVTGIYDADPAKAGKAASQYGVRAVASLAELAAVVDAMTIATPTPAHHAVAMEALRAGRHVFLEKPITETVAEAEEICAMARERNLIVQVGHIERFNPAILALDKFPITPMFVESHRLAQFNPRGTDVAVVLDLMIHDIDLILSFVKSPVRSVEANGVAVVSDSVDIANARLQFENGCVANVTASRISQRKMRKMRLFQKSGYISIDFSEGIAEVFRLVGEDEPDAKGTMMLGELGSGKHKRKIVYELPEVKEVNALHHEIGLFVQAVSTGGSAVVTGEDGKRALEVAGIIMEKIAQQSFSMS
jgi:predicted dehydrogenase